MRGEAISVLSLSGRYRKCPSFAQFNTCALMALSGSEFGTATN